MDTRGRILVNMVRDKLTESAICDETNQVDSCEGGLYTDPDHVSDSIDLSPCPEIQNGDPEIIQDLLDDMSRNEEDLQEQNFLSLSDASKNFDTNLASEMSLPSSVINEHMNDPIEHIPSNLPSLASSVINESAPGSVSSDKFMLIVGSTPNNTRNPEESGSEYCPSHESETSDEDSDDSADRNNRFGLDPETGILVRNTPTSSALHNAPTTSYSSDDSSQADDIFLDAETGLLTKNSAPILSMPIPNATPSEEQNSPAGRPKKGRKRKHIEVDRIQNKKNRNSNQKHYNYKGKLIEPRTYRTEPCKCSNKCHDKVPVKLMQGEFKRFWALGSYDAQNVYISARVKQVPTKSRNAKNFTRTYKIGNYTVCKTLFLSTYQVSSCRVNTALKKMLAAENEVNDMRGKGQGGHNKITDSMRNEIVEFIKRIPTYVSHYCRNKTEAKFFPPDVTLNKLIQMYNDEFKDKSVSASAFKSIFYSNFNLRTATLKKDTCNFCDKLLALMKNERDRSQMDILKNTHEDHLKKAEEAHQQLKNDIKLARQNEDIECITFDMEQTQPLPRIPTNVVFYKRQLWLYNEGVYSGKNDKGYCYVWVEGEAGKGAQEVGSVLSKHLKEELPNTVKKLILWSDSCGGQNRNIKITLMLKTVMEQLPNLEEVTFKFLYSGHSFLPNDRHFSIIESALKRQQRLYSPEDYMNVMKYCKVVNPLTVKKMNPDEFFSTANIEKHIVNRKTGTRKEKVSWLNSRQVNFTNSNKYIVNFKSSFEADAEEIALDIRRSRGSEIFSDMLIPLWPNGKPISTPKLKDIAFLLNYVPLDCRDFYLSLQAQSGVVDDVEGFNVAVLDFEEEFLENFDD